MKTTQLSVSFQHKVSFAVAFTAVTLQTSVVFQNVAFTPLGSDGCGEVVGGSELVGGGEVGVVGAVDGIVAFSVVVFAAVTLDSVVFCASVVTVGGDVGACVVAEAADVVSSSSSVIWMLS